MVRATEHSAAPPASAGGAAPLRENVVDGASEVGTSGLPGDERSAEFFEHYDFLRNYLRRQGAEEMMIEDALSQTAVRYTTRRPDGIDNVRAYLTRMASNALIDLLRAHRRKAEILVGDDWDLLPQESVRSAEDAVVENYLHDELLLKIRSLPVRQREAIMLIYIQGLPYQQAAAEMNVSVPLLRRTHSRALQTLRELFDVPSTNHLAT
ncbi:MULTISPECIES: sigma-70 family RNA polymerase sigma factor [unclassified Streptomyces]|uniref:RNA polymerase sigma factor n=1 Tax=unclassified Streptomyces TaxID=2593676 RepID=UPI000B4FDDC1|nr:MULTISPECIES: sigma-70 family RNA polymerase sigma factor [unclassified Streptomyces]MYW99892.1 sigma-70 family RNA polymerase sigma factor [Streptomyces sp. SID8378]SNB89858.1 Sigma-70 region 2 [Streptomyces sp. PgraA7]